MRCQLNSTLVAEGCYLETATVTDSVVGIRTSIGAGSRVERSVLLGADYYEPEPERYACRSASAARWC